MATSNHFPSISTGLIWFFDGAVFHSHANKYIFHSISFFLVLHAKWTTWTNHNIIALIYYLWNVLLVCVSWNDHSDGFAYIYKCIAKHKLILIWKMEMEKILNQFKPPKKTSSISNRRKKNRNEWKTIKSQHQKIDIHDARKGVRNNKRSVIEQE